MEGGGRGREEMEEEQKKRREERARDKYEYSIKLHPQKVQY